MSDHPSQSDECPQRGNPGLDIRYADQLAGSCCWFSVWRGWSGCALRKALREPG